MDGNPGGQDNEAAATALAGRGSMPATRGRAAGAQLAASAAAPNVDTARAAMTVASLFRTVFEFTLFLSFG